MQTLQKTSTAGNIGIDTINNNINNNIISQIRSINDGDLVNIDNVTNNLLYSINQRQIYTGKATNFNDRISELQAEIATLEGKTGKSTGNITTEKSGCFLSHCDGYENALDYNNLDRMTLSDLDNVKQTKVSGNIAGKVVTGLKWYVACKVTADEATRLSLWDGSATVLFSDASSESIPATIKRIYQESKDSDALLILECDYMNSDLAQARQEPIEIGLGSYTGLRISKKAIHDDYVTKTTYDDNDNKHTEQVKVQGVYVLHGSEVRFKQISILYADDDYVICDPEPDSKYNYKFIDERIAEAAEKSGRKREDITFLAATKMVEPEVINHAISLGLDHIGENKVQELLSKYDKYNLDNCSLQFIGHLQTNKVRQIIDKVDLIQSVDSIKLASEISKQALKINKNCDVLVEVNIGREENKSGVMPEQLEELLCQIAELDGISVKGLMAIPPICESSQKISEFFNKMHNIFIDISQKKLDNIDMNILSMGMSADYYEAVLAGANMVRVGSALFGARNYT